MAVVIGTCCILVEKGSVEINYHRLGDEFPLG